MVDKEYNNINEFTTNEFKGTQYFEENENLHKHRHEHFKKFKHVVQDIKNIYGHLHNLKQRIKDKIHFHEFDKEKHKTFYKVNETFNKLSNKTRQNEIKTKENKKIIKKIREEIASFFYKIILTLEFCILHIWDLICFASRQVMLFFSKCSKIIIQVIMMLVPSRAIKCFMITFNSIMPSIRGRHLTSFLLKITPSEISKKITLRYMNIYSLSEITTHFQVSIKSGPLRVIFNNLTTLLLVPKLIFETLFLILIIILKIIKKTFKEKILERKYRQVLNKDHFHLFSKTHENNSKKELKNKNDLDSSKCQKSVKLSRMKSLHDTEGCSNSTKTAYFKNLKRTLSF